MSPVPRGCLRGPDAQGKSAGLVCDAFPVALHVFTSVVTDSALLDKRAAPFLLCPSLACGNGSFSQNANS